MYKKINLCIVAVLLCAFFCTGCTDDKESNTKSFSSDAKSLPNIGLLLYTRGDVYISSVGEAVQKALAGKANVTLLYSDADQITQNEQISDFIDDKIDALLINLVDPQRVSKTLGMVQQANIPAIFFNREPDLSVIQRYPKACFVGTDAAEAGNMQGNIIAELWEKSPHFDRNKDGVFQYIMLQGNSDSAEAILRTQNSVRQAESKGVTLRQLGETYVCNWDKLQGKQAMTLAMDTFGDSIEIVISNNDSMALGALEVLNSRGFNTGDPQKFIPIIGVDAIAECCEAVRQGRMSATVKQDSVGMAEAMAALIMNALHQRDFLADTPYKWDESGVAVRIPYQVYKP